MANQDISVVYANGVAYNLNDSNAEEKIASLQSTKVDKVPGKDLSTNDYTNEEKNKLSGIESGANKTIVDSSMSTTSTNPVQNKVINDTLSKYMYIDDEGYICLKEA